MTGRAAMLDKVDPMNTVEKFIGVRDLNDTGHAYYMKDKDGTLRRVWTTSHNRFIHAFVVVATPEDKHTPYLHLTNSEEMPHAPRETDYLKFVIEWEDRGPDATDEP
jgi:hypothetical protein